MHLVAQALADKDEQVTAEGILQVFGHNKMKKWGSSSSTSNIILVNVQ